MSLEIIPLELGTFQFPEPELGSKLLTTGSFSLAYEMAGWRAGYFTAPAEHAGTMLELKQAMSICTSAVSQFAALAARALTPKAWSALIGFARGGCGAFEARSCAMPAQVGC